MSDPNKGKDSLDRTCHRFLSIPFGKPSRAYAVWIGPHECDQFSFLVRGTIRKGRYFDAGRTEVTFARRLPSGHQYAGKLYAELRCPEHASQFFTSDAMPVEIIGPPTFIERFMHLVEVGKAGCLRFAEEIAQNDRDFPDLQSKLAAGSLLPIARRLGTIR